MARLPTPGGDNGDWGDILNEFLQVAHNSDGTLQPISNSDLANNSITSSKLVNGTITGSKIADNTITDDNIASANIDGDATTPSLRTLGTGPNQAMPGDASVSPSAHADTHKGNGADPIDTATNSVAGLMSAADKTKLSAITASAAELNILDGATVSTTELNYVDGVTSSIQAQIESKQPADGDLTDISVLTPSNDDILQRKSGEWTNRTPAQLKLDLGLTKSDVGLGNVTNDAQLKIASNLADLNSAATARSNLGLGSAATQPASAFVQSGDITAMVVLTQAEFDLIFTPDPTTLYVVTD